MAKAMALINVKASPKAMPDEVLNEIKPIPARHNTADKMWFRLGNRWKTIHPKKGTITQYAAVKKALFPASVP